MIFGSKFSDKIDTDLDITTVSNEIELSRELRSYWVKRNEYFPNFDEMGYLTDEEGLYSITPYKAANTIASRFKSYQTVVDAFCGIGGNTIAFAKLENIKKVIAIEIDPTRIEIAKYNAKVAGVYDKIQFICGDALLEIPKLSIDAAFAIFCSPAWNFEHYKKNTEVYSLNDTTPNSFEVFAICKSKTPNIALMLPRHTELKDLQSFQEIFEIQHFKRKQTKSVQFVCVYYGKLIKYIQ
eukprot:NODE_299_length_10456_cov_1.003669.p4 type:complete len:239 gc:universal NODE_299_length_10456_cov_1.003669:162-878(+)